MPQWRLKTPGITTKIQHSQIDTLKRRQTFVQVTLIQGTQTWKMYWRCKRRTGRQWGKGRDARMGKPSWEVLSSSLTGRSNCQHQRDLIVSIHWIIEKARELQKDIYFCFLDYFKAFDCVDNNKLENSLRDGNTRPLCLPPEKSVRRSRSNS